MVDPVEAGAVAAALYSGRKTLGPTLDLIGTELRDAVAPRIQNLAAIIDRAEKRGGEAADDESVHPRVLNHFVHEGSWVDDAIHQEYVAGVLISARTQDADDDMLETLTTVTSMTSRQIRLHHAAYWALAAEARDQEWGLASVRMRHTLFAETDAIVELLDTDNEAASLIAESLDRRSLLDVSALGGGPPTHGVFPSAQSFADPFIATPTLLGISVFLAGYGVRRRGTLDLNLINWSAMLPIGPVVPSAVVRPLDCL